MSGQRLVIGVSGRRIAVDVDIVEEVVDRGTVTLLPQLPPAMPGVVDLRGRAIPIVDLGVLAGEPPQYDRRSMLIASDGDRPLAILIDTVEWCDEWSDAAIETESLLDLHRLLENLR